MLVFVFSILEISRSYAETRHELKVAIENAIIFKNKILTVKPCYPDSYSTSWTNCIGEMVYESGTKYLGEFKNGRTNGYGKYIRLDGGGYIGQSKNGLLHGNGTHVYNYGTIYSGQWKKNKWHGLGVFKPYKGFRGQWKQGHGSITIYDDRPIEGYFENGKFLYASERGGG